jgi:hypothetical protein
LHEVVSKIGLKIELLAIIILLGRKNRAEKIILQRHSLKQDI